MTVGNQPCRLATGGLIDRSRPLRFRWAGRSYEGFAGDTLASALLANGVKLLGRSFKYHRPRGLVAAGVEEPNVLVQLGEGGRSTPNVRATEVALYDGLVAKPVNCWPSANFDIAGINNLASSFLAAGFYYKTFMWPSWHFYEGLIRRAAGLGRAATEADPDRYASRYAHFDVVVIGGGRAGIVAALAAAEDGVTVALVEQDQMLGGTLLIDDEVVEGLHSAIWLEQSRAKLDSAGVRVLCRTTATGYFDHDALVFVEENDEAGWARDPNLPRACLWQVRAGRVVLATGAVERPIVFPGNDRPGVMLAGAVRSYVRRHAALPGKRTVVFTNNDEAYRTAECLLRARSAVVAVVDTRDDIPATLAARLIERGVQIYSSAAIVRTRGYRGLRRAEIRLADGKRLSVACDCIAMSGGFTPTTHLFSQSGGKLRYDEADGAFVPDRGPQSVTCVGAAAGGARGRAAPIGAIKGKGKAFVDYQHDVTADDIGLAARESFRSVEHLKRYTTLGMAPDQGKTSNVNAIAIMAAETGRSVAATGTTRFRFPYTPMPLASFAGRDRGDLFRPLRRMPGHERHAATGAVFEDFGGYLRPACYIRAGESHLDAERREAAAVRSGAGLFEGSPLGKIEVVGPDAARFLDLIYANRVSNLQSGKVRYGLMLNELGVIIDDGVVTRLGDQHFLVSTTSGGADRIAAWLEEWLQCEWVDLDVVVAPITTAWGVLTLTGPNARAILRALGTSIDVGREAFPHMSYREGTVGGVDARVHRVSFTGEVSYEISVWASRVAPLWDRLMEVGHDYGITPVGIDAWMILRTEKGYMHVGGDTDGATTPLNVGWDHVLKKTSDFVGKRSLTLPENVREDRFQFVGFSAFGGEPLPVGGHVVGADGRSEGYVTSSHLSPTLGRGVALGMLRGGAARLGERIVIRTLDGLRDAVVAPVCAFDPTGERLDA